MDQEQLAIAHTREAYDPSTVIGNMLRHPLKLQSAYMEVAGAEPEFTSCHDRFCGTVDYIWYTPQVSVVCRASTLTAVHYLDSLAHGGLALVLHSNKCRPFA